MNKKNSVAIGAVLVSLSAIMWGFDGVVLTPRLAGLDVTYIVMMLHLIPFVLLNFFLYRQYRFIKEFTRSDWAILILIALTGGSFGTIAIVKALIIVHFKPLSVVVLLQKLQPLFAILLSFFLLKEKLSRHYFIYALIAVAASYFLIFGLSTPDLHASAETIQAAFYAVIAAFCFGSATVFGKMILMRFESETALFYRYGLTSLFMTLMVLASGKLVTQIGATDSFKWMIFVIIALTTGTTAIYIYYRGLQKVTATVSTICELFLPISSVAFDFIFNGKLLGPVQLIAAVIMVSSIFLLTREHAAENPGVPVPDEEVSLT